MLELIWWSLLVKVISVQSEVKTTNNHKQLSTSTISTQVHLIILNHKLRIFSSVIITHRPSNKTKAEWMILWIFLANRPLLHKLTNKKILMTFLEAAINPWLPRAQIKWMYWIASTLSNHKYLISQLFKMEIRLALPGRIHLPPNSKYRKLSNSKNLNSRHFNRWRWATRLLPSNNNMDTNSSPLW